MEKSTKQENSHSAAGPKQTVREQMPGIWKYLDDPFGLIWRTRNAVKRFSLQRSVRFAKGWLTSPVYQRPVFIIGAPRSGTSMLFQVLCASDQFVHLGREGHDLWRAYHHPRWHGWHSDAIGAGQVGRGERRFVGAYLYAHAGAGRLLEKTPCNSLRIPYLLELFPDAHFVVIKRNPCDVINSLINGWRDPMGRFRNYYVPARLTIPGYQYDRRWCFTLINGWRDLTASNVPDIAFAQWREFIEQLDLARSIVPAAQWTEIGFEDFLAAPHAMSGALFSRLDVVSDPLFSQRLDKLMANPINALSAPDEEKWRKQNPEEITALLPRISALAPLAGYTVDPTTGACAILRK